VAIKPLCGRSRAAELVAEAKFRTNALLALVRGVREISDSVLDLG
jgi:hypothetical protein